MTALLSPMASSQVASGRILQVVIGNSKEQVLTEALLRHKQGCTRAALLSLTTSSQGARCAATIRSSHWHQPSKEELCGVLGVVTESLRWAHTHKGCSVVSGDILSSCIERKTARSTWNTHKPVKEQAFSGETLRHTSLGCPVVLGEKVELVSSHWKHLQPR